MRHNVNSAEERTGVVRATLVGLAVNIALAAVKLTIGLIVTSRALIADAIHTLSDLVTDFLILVGIRYWSAPADDQHPYGHRKIETLVTVGIGFVLAVVGIAVGLEAVDNVATRIYEPASSTPTLGPGWIAALAAILTIVSKEWLFRWTAKRGAILKSSVLVANAWHHRSDGLSSIPVAIAIIGANIGPIIGRDLSFLDPMGAIVVSLMILQAAWKVVRPCVAELVDAGADRATREKIEILARATPGVRHTHRIRTRRIGPNAIAVDLHIQVDGALSVREGHAIGGRVKAAILREVEDAVDVIVHLEADEPDKH